MDICTVCIVALTVPSLARCSSPIKSGSATATKMPRTTTTIISSISVKPATCWAVVPETRQPEDPRFPPANFLPFIAVPRPKNSRPSDAGGRERGDSRARPDPPNYWPDVSVTLIAPDLPQPLTLYCVVDEPA